MSTRACCRRPRPINLAGAHFQTGDMYVADETYSGVRPMAVSSEGIGFVKNIMVPTRDGTKLAMDIHVPAGEGPWPVILTYIPYRKDDQAPLTGMQHHWAQHGYVGARVDCRGTGSSEGSNDDEYRPVEHRDGFDMIEWIAEQDWCDGKVAMTGGSYGGFSSVQVAALAPPHLETIIPWNYTDDRYTDDCHYRGGALRCYYDIGAYGCSMVGMNSMPPYPEYSGDRWAELWEEHLEQNNPYLLTWLANQKDGEYWRPGSIRGRYHEIKASGAAHRGMARRLLQRAAKDVAAHEGAEQGAHRPVEPLRAGLRNTRSLAGARASHCAVVRLLAQGSRQRHHGRAGHQRLCPDVRRSGPLPHPHIRLLADGANVPHPRRSYASA